VKRCYGNLIHPDSQATRKAPVAVPCAAPDAAISGLLYHDCQVYDYLCIFSLIRYPSGTEPFPSVVAEALGISKAVQVQVWYIFVLAFVGIRRAEDQHGSVVTGVVMHGMSGMTQQPGFSFDKANSNFYCYATFQIIVCGCKRYFVSWHCPCRLHARTCCYPGLRKKKNNRTISSTQVAEGGGKSSSVPFDNSKLSMLRAGCGGKYWHMHTCTSVSCRPHACSQSGDIICSKSFPKTSSRIGPVTVRDSRACLEAPLGSDRRKRTFSGLHC
jgi:hypothetical protein